MIDLRYPGHGFAALFPTLVGAASLPGTRRRELDSLASAPRVVQ